MSYIVELMIACCSNVPWSMKLSVEDLSTFGALRAGIPNRVRD